MSSAPNRLFAGTLALLLTGCAATRIPVPPPSGDTVTVLVPGYRGSFLDTVGPEPERAWITASQGLSRGERSLALPFPGQRPAAVYGPLRPAGPVTRIVAPFVTVDAYGSFLEYGRDHFPGLVPFSYDWREDVRTSADVLCARLEQLVAEGRREVNLVAHSMGGLVTLHCLLHGGSRTREAGGGRAWAGAGAVKRVVILGTPFQGSPGLFDDLLVGTVTARNRALLPPEALFTFPAAFQLLPPRGTFFFGADGAPLAWDALDAGTWWTRGWGPFADASLREDAAYRAQLQRQLEANRALHAALTPRDVPPPPFEVLVVVGTGRPSTRGFRVVEGRLDIEHPVQADGDGAVLATSALPGLPLPYRRLDSGAEHIALVSDRDVLAAIERFLRGETVGTPAHTTAEGEGSRF